jgi:endoglucanase
MPPLRQARPAPFVLAAALSLVVATGGGAAAAPASVSRLRLNAREYFAMPGLDVTVFQDIYPEGHQGGVGIIQNGVRVASNGDLRLESAPGQWAPVPIQGERTVDRQKPEIAVTLSYPDPSKDQKGFNPLEYPKDLRFAYKVRVHPEGASFRITVDLDQPLPDKWIGRVGFNLELFPGALFGKPWYLDGQSGIFPRQPNGPVRVDADQRVQPVPYATGQRLVIAPDSPAQRMTVESRRAPLELLDGRVNYQNGWFIVRAPVAAGATRAAVDWLVTPSAIPGWRYPPVVHVSQVGYHPAQRKVAVIELDAADTRVATASLIRFDEGAPQAGQRDGRGAGQPERVLTAKPRVWGPFLRYRYLQFDFTAIKRPGVYAVEYAGRRTEPFRIAGDVFQRGVWQPTLDYFLPVQMCHMRVREKYRIWHGLCHMDDARMAPAGNHFDGYFQGPSTLTTHKSLEPLAGLDVGGWHDAGDDDLRIESQAGEVYILALAYEAFGLRYDNTRIDERGRQVDIREPDGKPDLLQQVEHGVRQILGAYHSLGRLYRGMISPTLPQYTMVGDVSNQTDGLVYDPKLRPDQRTATHSGRPDDRLVFTEDNPARELTAAAGIAAAARVLRGYDDALAADCLRVAEALWQVAHPVAPDTTAAKAHAAVELLLATRRPEYRRFLIDHAAIVQDRIGDLGWVVGRALPLVDDAGFTAAVRAAVAAQAAKARAAEKRNPFGVPYEPVIWGAGWGIQKFGVDQYFLHAAFPDLVGVDYVLGALDFVLGCHPGANTASFASGVGARSMTTAYGYNRADWSYIPGGVVSGTALIRPDFPELKDFPFLWQQAEYVLGGGSSNFMFLALAANQLLGP